MPGWTPTKLLDWMTQFFTDKQVDSPRLSAEMLLSYVLDMQRIELYVNFEKEVPQDKLDELREMVKRAAEHEPIAYLVGKTEFYSMEIEVSRDTLIPRPETELLVEKAIDVLRAKKDRKYVLDLCTGSGCIAVAIAKNCPDVKLIATDVCEKAVAVAERNIEKHNLTERIHLLQGDIFDPIVEKLDETEFDLIVSNPPYVTESEYLELERNVKDYEPCKALVAGADGLDVYKRIAEKLGDFLKPDGVVIFEIGYKQADAVREILESTNLFNGIDVLKDFCNNDRVIIAKR